MYIEDSMIHYYKIIYILNFVQPLTCTFTSDISCEKVHRTGAFNPIFHVTSQATYTVTPRQWLINIVLLLDLYLLINSNLPLNSLSCPYHSLLFQQCSLLQICSFCVMRPDVLQSIVANFTHVQNKREHPWQLKFQLFTVIFNNDRYHHIIDASCEEEGAIITSQYSGLTSNSKLTNLNYICATYTVKPEHTGMPRGQNCIRVWSGSLLLERNKQGLPVQLT